MFDVHISKEEILKQVSPEEILEYYLNGKYLVGRAIQAPYRVDKTPSLSLFYNNLGELLFKDHAENKSGSCISLVQRILGLNYQDTLKRIQNDLLSNKSSNNFRSSKINTGNNQRVYLHKSKYTSELSFQISFKQKEFSKRDISWWESYGVTKEGLDFFNIKCASHIYYNKKLWIIYSINNPCYIYQEGNEFKIYRPLASKQNRWSGNMKSHTLLGINQIPDNYNKLILLNKGYKDVASIWCNHNIPGICKSGENCYWTQEDIDRIKKKSTNLLFLGDFDNTGLRIANKLHKDFNIDRIFMSTNRKERRFDYSDYYLNFGKELTVKKLNRLIYDTLQV